MIQMEERGHRRRRCPRGAREWRRHRGATRRVSLPRQRDPSVLSPNVSPVEADSGRLHGRNRTAPNSEPNSGLLTVLNGSGRPPHNPKVAGSNPAPATIYPGQRPRFGGVSLVVGDFYRVFYRVEVGGRHEQRFEGASGFGLHPGQHVLVGRHRETGRRVLETFTDDLDWGARLEQQRGGGVTKVVQSKTRYVERSDETVECLREEVWVRGPAFDGWKEVVVEAHGPVELASESFSPAGENVNGRRVEVDAATR